MIKIIKAIFFALASMSIFIIALFLLIISIFPEYTFGRRLKHINLPRFENIGSIEITNNTSIFPEEFIFSKEEELIKIASLFENNSKDWLIYCYDTAPSYKYTIKFNLTNNSYIIFYSDLDRMIATSGDEDQCLKTKKISPQEMIKLHQLIKK